MEGVEEQDGKRRRIFGRMIAKTGGILKHRTDEQQRIFSSNSKGFSVVPFPPIFSLKMGGNKEMMTCLVRL